MSVEMDVDEITLTQGMYHLVNRIQREFPKVEFNKPEHRWDSLGEHYIARISWFLWNNEQVDQEVRYPANWFEALKEKYMPEGLKERYPVIYAVHTFKEAVIYPDLAIPGHRAIRKQKLIIRREPQID